MLCTLEYHSIGKELYVGFRKDLGVAEEDFAYPEQNEVTKKWIDVREETLCQKILSLDHIPTDIDKP